MSRFQSRLVILPPADTEGHGTNFCGSEKAMSTNNRLPDAMTLLSNLLMIANKVA